MKPKSGARWSGQQVSSLNRGIAGAGGCVRFGAFATELFSASFGQ